MALDDALTDKQARFCVEYLIDLNASAAARRAGYSDESSGSIGYQLLQETRIWVRIAELMEKRNNRVLIDGDDVLRQLKRIAFGDTRRVATWGPNGVTLRSSDELTDDEAAMISEVSETTTIGGGSIKFKTKDQIRALELIMKHLGMLREGAARDNSQPVAPRVTFTRAQAPTDA